MRENEVKALWNRYFSHKDNAGIFYIGNDDACDYFIDMVDNGEIHWADAPDVIVIKDNDVLLIEHFEFSCYKANKTKGNSIRKELTEFWRDFVKISSENSSATVMKRINSKSSSEDYIKNVKSAFEKHYRKIERYKKNAFENFGVSSNAKIKIMFLLEDVSPEGWIIYNRKSKDKSFCLSTLAKDRRFLEFFAEHCNVDYVMCCAHHGSIYETWLIDRVNIDENLESAYDELECKAFSAIDYLFISKEI